ncbi:hypothetical protein KSX_89250 [Ktedonospora formicarum]|uniref:Uncharacterized protein n=2 Tax=Ktedonospora formicarum TaxID=2778364 RepID=A0A8J3I5M0_9CHLR|nr:hypothetical protein KSX_89250 [Ktedonospora formicarum]
MFLDSYERGELSAAGLKAMLEGRYELIFGKSGYEAAVQRTGNKGFAPILKEVLEVPRVRATTLLNKLLERIGE